MNRCTPTTGLLLKDYGSSVSAEMSDRNNFATVCRRAADLIITVNVMFFLAETVFASDFQGVQDG
jgi:hypothetical protein